MDGTEGAIEGTETESTESTEVTQSDNTDAEIEAGTGTKEAKANEDDEFEVVKSANREWRLPKDAAKDFKSLRRGYTQATQQAAELRKMIEELESDPESAVQKILSKKGLDADDWAEKRLMRKLEQLNKSPEQVKMEEYEREIETYRKRDADQVRQKQEAEDRAMEAYVAKQLDEEISKAWKESKLPADPVYVKHISALIIDSMKLAQAGKIERILTAKEAADIVVKKQRSTWKTTLPTLEVDELLELIGPEKFNALKQAELARLTKSASNAGFGQRQGNSKESTQNAMSSKRSLTEKEFRALYEN